MARIDNVSNCLADIATAIKEKTGDTNAIPVKEFDNKIRGISSGGININGNIESHKVAVDENISAGSFVKFIDKSGIETSMRAISSTGSVCGMQEIDENRVFVIYQKQIETGFAKCNLCGAILQIDKNEILGIGAEVVLSEYGYAHAKSFMSILEGNKILIVYKSSKDNCSHGMLITINGNNVIKNENTDIPLNLEYENSVDMKCIDKSNIIYIYLGENSTGMKGKILTITNDTILVGTEIIFSTKTNAIGFSSILSKENKIFITHSEDSNSYLYLMIITINNGEITVNGNHKLLNNTASGSHVKSFFFGGNKIYILHSVTTNHNLGYTLVTIDNDTINGTCTETKLLSYTRSSWNIDAKYINDNEIIVVYNSSGTTNFDKPNFMLISMDGASPAVIKNASIYGNIENYFKEIAILKNNKMIFMSWNSSLGLYFALFAQREGICNRTSIDDSIFGITKIAGTEGQTIEVYTPKI